MFVRWYNNTNSVRVDTIQYARRNEEILGGRLRSVTGSFQI